jgi:hypothetical protein
MKKLFILTLFVACTAVVAPAAVASSRSAAGAAMEASPAQVWTQRRGRNWNRRYRRTVVTTRIRWINGRRYRERVRITYFPNGRTRVQLISRVRLSGRRW